jgi:hypothetical protein
MNGILMLIILYLLFQSPAQQTPTTTVSSVSTQPGAQDSEDLADPGTGAIGFGPAGLTPEQEQRRLEYVSTLAPGETETMPAANTQSWYYIMENRRLPLGATFMPLAPPVEHPTGLVIHEI